MERVVTLVKTCSRLRGVMFRRCGDMLRRCGGMLWGWWCKLVALKSSSI